MIRMKRVTFFKLCDCLRERNLLHDTLNVTLEEQVAVFLHIVGHNVRNRVVGHNFMRSEETVSRYFNEVLRAIGELRRELIRRPSLNTHSRITSIVKILNEKLGIQVINNNVYNHLRGWRNKWSQIVKLKEKSGMSWNENEKRIVMGRDEYLSYIKNHPKDAALINKSIDFYDQMSIIFGGSLAIGRWTHSTQGASSSSGKIKKKSSKRHRENEEDIMTMVANNIKKLVVEIKEYNEPEIFIDGLYEAVMSIPGFDDSQLCRAYRMLVGSSTKEARAFMVASTHHRYFWIRDMLNM
ncbi:hypothetical protein Cni_G25396 [Canna indica]|uniref:Myb/SANT-like domain-containing protein n=1 Tax=Canna indica TaxID=4628 RepID=A0AAQ3KWX3_9LILI|nr:hypothetical protein Cni_G25396 [Canna indica]